LRACSRRAGSTRTWAPPAAPDLTAPAPCRLTYKVWEDRSSSRITLDSAKLSCPGATGLLHELQIAATIGSVGHLPVRKEVWLREWDEDWLDEEIAAAFSLFDDDNSPLEGGTFSGDLLTSRMGQEYIDGSLSNLPLQWRQITEG
jgi:hypothetical protein